LIKIAGLSKGEKSVSQLYKQNYRDWRQFRKKTNDNYFILPTELEKYLPNNKAINLYLYYCFKAKNEGGDSWHSVNTIAESLGVTPKTVNTWNKTLVDLGMIARLDDNHLSKATILLPLSSYYKIIPNSSLQDVTKSINAEVEGKLTAVYHLFEWRKNEANDNYDVPFNSLCFVLERKTEVDTIYKFLLVQDETINDFELKTPSSKVFEDAYRFECQKLGALLRENKLTDIAHENFIVSSKYNLVSEKDSDLLKLLKELTENLDNKEHITIL
jgi:predicted transcriptional regulator